MRARADQSSGPPARIWFITHPEVVVDPATPVPLWSLSPVGIDRMNAFCRRPDLGAITAIWSSAETKAVEGAAILAGRLGLRAAIDEQLHENDRSATGFLPPPEFQLMADRFFAHPHDSVEGWERAVDAQDRIVRAVDRLAAGHDLGGELAIVAHGGVGALLLGALEHRPISRQLDQPGSGGGNFYVFGYPDKRIERAWTDIAAPA